MKKVVNGKTINIDNIDLFEAAAEGAAIGRTLPNIIPNSKLDIDFDFVESIISVYKNYYASLPYPLYYIDCKMKYVCAGLLIKKEKALKNKMWIDNGLFICIDEYRMLCLGFVNNSWGVINVKEIKNDTMDIMDYDDELGYDEFVWVLAQLFQGKSTESYYNNFMKQFVDACGGQSMIMKWELGNMLSFSEIPNKMYFTNNRIHDYKNNGYYYLDVFLAGKMNSDKKIIRMANKVTEDTQKVSVYGYDIYFKRIIDNEERARAGSDKVKVVEMYGMNSLFCTICSIKMNSESSDFPIYTGYIDENNNFVFLVNGRLFLAKENMYVEPLEIARNVEIYSYKDNVIYINKFSNISAGIRKEKIYSYDIESKKTKLCKIQFSRV